MTSLLTRAPDLTTEVPYEPTPAATSAPDRRPVGAERVASRLVLTGALSRADVEWLEPELEALVASGHRTLEVELSGVLTMDAAVARLLLRTSWHLGDPDRALLLLHPRPQVHRVLRFSGAGGLVVR